MQKRSFEFRDDDKTIDLDNWLLGVYKPSRMAGFDFVVSNNTTLNLNHATTGVDIVDVNGVSAKYGVVVMPTGLIVKEDSQVSIPVNPNNGLTVRYDLIYLSHQYRNDVIGGQQATYGVVEGSSGLIPELTDPTTQVAIGLLVWPSSTLVIDSTVRFIPSAASLPRLEGISHIKNGVTTYNLANATTEIVINLEDLETNYKINATESLTGTKKIILLGENEINQGKKTIFEISLSQSNANANFNFVSKRNSGASEVVLFSILKEELKYNSKVFVGVQVNEIGLIVESYTPSDSHNAGRQNRNNISWIDAPQTLQTVDYSDRDLGTTYRMIPLQGDFVPSYFVYSGDKAEGFYIPTLTMYAGQSFMVEVGNNSGLQLFSKAVPSTIESVDTNCVGIVFGSSNGVFNNTSESYQIYAKKGQVIEFVVNSQGKLVVKNEMLFNNVSGNALAIQATRKFFSDFKIANDTVLPIGTIKPSLDSSRIALPSDGVPRKIEVLTKANITKPDNASDNVCVQQLLVKNGIATAIVGNSSNVALFNNGIDYGDTVCYYKFDHNGDGGYVETQFVLAGTDPVSATGIIISVNGIPTVNIG